MGKAYSEEQRARVRVLLESGRDEEAIEKETGVSDRTIRRWKMELERTGRIGKPPESRTGRHRVLNADIEAALFEHVKTKPDMSVDDMLWWLYDNHNIVVGTRTIRRVFERKGDKVKTSKSHPLTASVDLVEGENDDGEQEVEGEEVVDQEEEVGVDEDGDASAASLNAQYQSPYAPLPPTPVPTGSSEIENQLRQAMQQQTPQHPYPALMELNSELPDDEETIQLELQQIALQKREVELKLKMRRMQGGGKPTPTGRRSIGTTSRSAPSSLYNPQAAMAPTPPKRDSRSKKKIEESKRRTAERQERMLRDLERRSRRRDHLTAEWVHSKDIWPLRAQGLLADLMHQYACYAYTQGNDATFEAMYRDLYQLVDLTKDDWNPHVHDELLRERMKRKMAQLRTKMVKTGEIVGRTDGFPGYQKAENYTGEQAGAAVGDESEMVQDPALHAAADALQAQAGAASNNLSPDEHIHYDPVPPDQQMPQTPMAYPNPIMHHQGPAQYGLMDQHHNMLPYAPLGSQQGLSHQESMVI